MRVAVAWLLVALSAGWVAMRLLGLERGFPLVPLVAYTPFVTVGVVLVVGVAALLRQRAAAVAAAVLAALLVVMVAPRALGGPSRPEGATGPTVVVVSANMRWGNGSADELVALVRRSRASVLSVQELTPDLVRRLDEAGLASLLPERILEAREDPSGIGLFANVPLSAVPAPGARHNPLVMAAADVRGAVPLEVAAVHAPPPLRGARTVAWQHDLRALPRATPDARLRVLAGDFNATLDHAELRRLLDSGYADAAAEVGAGLQFTWPRRRQLWPLPVAIDHVLADERIGVREFSVHAIPGTDHRAVVAELVFPRP